MSVQSLLNQTIPVSGAGNSGLLMPKLKYRFRVTFQLFGQGSTTTELTKQVIDFQRPNLNFNPITIDIYNAKVFLTGKPEWQPVTINFRDDAVGNVSRLIGGQVQKQFDFQNMASASAGGSYKFNTKFEVLDGGNGAVAPTILETFNLYGCFISEVNYNNFEYNSNDPATISVTVRYDNAEQDETSLGVGSAGTVGGFTTTVA